MGVGLIGVPGVEERLLSPQSSSRDASRRVAARGPGRPSREWRFEDALPIVAAAKAENVSEHCVAERS
jgi:hypothetical protein